MIGKLLTFILGFLLGTIFGWYLIDIVIKFIQGGLNAI